MSVQERLLRQILEQVQQVSEQQRATNEALNNLLATLADEAGDDDDPSTYMDGTPVVGGR